MVCAVCGTCVYVLCVVYRCSVFGGVCCVWCVCVLCVVYRCRVFRTSGVCCVWCIDVGCSEPVVCAVCGV